MVQSGVCTPGSWIQVENLGGILQMNWNDRFKWTQFKRGLPFPFDVLPNMGLARLCAAGNEFHKHISNRVRLRGKKSTDSMGHFEASSLASFWVPDRPIPLQGQHPKHEAGSVS